MHPILIELGPVAIRSYALFVGLAFLVAWAVRRSEVRRLGYQLEPAHRWVGLGALAGAVVGAKLGMLLFTPPEGFAHLLAMMTDLDFTGKTVVGAIAGGYLGVELTKKRVGIIHSTGDGWAVALPLGQGIGRLGCFFNGCCYGTPTDARWGVVLAEVRVHPVQLYETALDLALAATLFSIRGRPYPEGHLFRRYLVGYAVIRFGLEFFRGDAGHRVAGLTLVQWVCLAATIGFGSMIVMRERGRAVKEAPDRP